MRITIVAGARPNFIKIAPIISAIETYRNNGFNLSYRLIHTGQHFDEKMSSLFFEQLNIPKPERNLGISGGSGTWQTANIMLKFEDELIKCPTDLVLVVGDVNSTMACSLVAKKMNVKVAYVEGGIRSGDLTMPEEINRIVTDSISDYFFTTSNKASENLMKSGVDEANIFFVGNTMIDTLLKYKSKFIKPQFWESLGLKKKSYILLTMHRPANVDEKLKLEKFLVEIIKCSNGLPIIFPAHPRTKKILNELSIDKKAIYVCEPLGYLEFNYLSQNAKVVITDSGGITEETTVMGVPCITLRDNTERPETVTIGTNELIGTDPSLIQPVLTKLFSGKWKKGAVPKLWDGKTSERIVQNLIKLNSL